MNDRKEHLIDPDLLKKDLEARIDRIMEDITGHWQAYLHGESPKFGEELLLARELANEYLTMDRLLLLIEVRVAALVELMAHNNRLLLDLIPLESE